MTRLMKTALGLALALALVFALAAYAAAESVPRFGIRSGRSGDFTYSILEDDTACILRYIGDGTDVTFPDTLDGHTVSAVAMWPFGERKEEIVRVVLPDTVTRIDHQVFEGCSALKEIVLPRGLTEIPDGAFLECVSLTDVVLPDTLTVLGISAFDRCRALTRLDLPASLTSIGAAAFFECESLTDITLPAGLTELGNGAFCRCGSLRQITVPDGITLLGGDVFNDCKSLESVSLPDTLTIIGPSAFAGCESLREIRLPSALTEIRDYAFVSCDKLERVTLPRGLAVIKDSAFSNCESLTEAALPESLAEVGQFVFGNSGVKRLVWPRSVPAVPRYLCHGCKRLTEVVLPDTVTEIGEYAFDMCDALQTVALPGKLAKIGQRAFSGTGLTGIVLPDSVTDMGENVFYDCWELKKAVLSRGMTWIAHGTFGSCRGLTDVTIPDTVTEIRSGAFSGCKSLKSIRLPAGLTVLGSAFSSCTSLTEILLPESLTQIESGAFYRCEGLLSVIWPAGVGQIDSITFGRCSSLTYIYLPETVTDIHLRAFENCPLLHAAVTAGSEAEKYCKMSRIPYSVLPVRRPVANPTAAPADENGRELPAYADVWARTWTGTDDPASSLRITKNVDGTLRLRLRVPGVLNWISEAEASDYEAIDLSDGLFYGSLYINAAMGCRLEMRLFCDEIIPGHPLCAPLYGAGSGSDGVTLVFTADPAPDLTPYGVRKYVEDLIDEWESGQPEPEPEKDETQRLLEQLAGRTFIAASGAGAWEGRLTVHSDGSFSGYYYDADADVIYEVAFSGDFIPSGTERRGETAYGLWVENLKTERVPGTEGLSEYGDRIVYTEAPISDRAYLLLTLPGTPDEEIPEAVREEIGGALDEWEDYSRFMTLTREDGWGFFADPTLPEPPGLEPVPTAAPTAMPTAVPTAAPTAAPTAVPTAAPTAAPTAVPTAAPTAAPEGLSSWTGNWMTRDDSYAEMIVSDRGDGTLGAQMFFLPAVNCNAVLTPQADGSLRFSDENGSLTGSLVRQADGAVRLMITGGSAMEDEEATVYQGYYARGFLFYPAAYEDMWYQTPADAAATEDDWLGNWVSVTAGVQSTLRISRESGALRADAALGPYRFSGLLDMAGDTIAALYDDDFNCLLLLNKKLKKIAMMEVGSGIDGVYALMDGAYYGVVMYQFIPATPVQIPENRQPDDRKSIFSSPAPAPTAAPGGLHYKWMDGTIWQENRGGEDAGLLPIPGKPGYRQVPVSRADATTWIVGQDPSAYVPSRMIDGDETTSYQFSTKKAKPGQAYVYFDFDSPVTLDEMWMKNGFWKYTDGKDQYTRNSRVKKMTLSVRCAGSEGYRELKTVTLKDDKTRRDWKVIRLDGQRNVTGVRIRIDAIYAGSKYKNDVCISEIMFVRAVGSP